MPSGGQGPIQCRGEFHEIRQSFSTASRLLAVICGLARCDGDKRLSASGQQAEKLPHRTAADRRPGQLLHRWRAQSHELCRGADTHGDQPNQVTIGQMYVQFQIPAKQKSQIPTIMVHGSTHTGACLESTPDEREGWAPYFVRNGVATYVVDQAGRGRSGFDASVIHEGVALVNDGDVAGGTQLIPSFGRITDNGAWTLWFGHLVGRARPPRARTSSRASCNRMGGVLTTPASRASIPTPPGTSPRTRSTP